jgi:beta-lactamase class A
MSTGESCRLGIRSGSYRSRWEGVRSAKAEALTCPGFHAVCAPGRMVFEDRWVYFAFIINWQAAAVTDPQTVAAFVKTAGQAMTIVKDALTT